MPLLQLTRDAAASLDELYLSDRLLAEATDDVLDKLEADPNAVRVSAVIEDGNWTSVKMVGRDFNDGWIVWNFKEPESVRVIQLGRLLGSH